MNNLIIFTAFLFIVSGTVNANDFVDDARSGLIITKPGVSWVNESERIGAYFPSKPQILNATGSSVSAKRFFSRKQYSEGNAQFSITIIPLSKAKNSPAQQKDQMQFTLNELLMAGGAIQDTIKTKWESFSDDRPQLYYEYIFLEQGYPLSSRGFLVMDEKRIISVSVLYLSTLPTLEEREVSSFLGTFILLE